MSAKDPNSIDFWQKYLEAEVPLSKGMKLQVSSLGPVVIIKAPLEPNQNNKGTAFAGSLSSALALSGWMATQLWIDPALEKYDVVLHRSDLSFQLPVTADFEVHVELSPAPDAKKVTTLLGRYNKARVLAAGKVLQDGTEKVVFKGEYVILPRP